MRRELNALLILVFALAIGVGLVYTDLAHRFGIDRVRAWAASLIALACVAWGGLKIAQRFESHKRLSRERSAQKALDEERGRLGLGKRYGAEFIYSSNFNEWVRRMEALADTPKVDHGFPVVETLAEAQSRLVEMGWVKAWYGLVDGQPRPYELWASAMGSNEQIILSWKTERIGIQRVPTEMAF